MQPDTLIPAPANLQAWNRYAYVLNNPIRFIDPTGHAFEQGTGFGGNKCTLDCQLVKRKNNKDKYGGEPSARGASTSVIQQYGVPGGLIGPPEPPTYGNGLIGPPGPAAPKYPIDDYCYGNVDLACAANMFQDAATLVDLGGVVFLEIPNVTAGCAAGGPAGCVAAEGATILEWNLSPLNPIETALSGISLVLTGLDDSINNGGFGENTYTSVATFLAGSLPLTPSWDLVVDGYASGYNHGIFNGVGSIFSGSPIYK